MPDDAGPSRESNMVGGCGMCMSLQAVRAPRNVGHGLVVVRTRATCMHAPPRSVRPSSQLGPPDNRASRDRLAVFRRSTRPARTREYTFVCASSGGVLSRHL